MTDSTTTPFRAGFVALVGRPNAGKSTLLNRILGQKLAAVTPKPQTTRERILGVKHLENAQIAFVDTPGYHVSTRELNQYMVREALQSIQDVDLVVLLADALDAFHEEQQLLLAELIRSQKPTVLVLNKIDRVAEKERLLPLLEEWGARHPFVALIPLSALRGKGVERLLETLVSHLPVVPAPLFPEEEFTDRSARFLVGELIREQIFLKTGQEVPYATAVTIDLFDDPEEKGETPGEKKVVRICATIHVEKPSQKSIIIGKGGQQIKEIGTAARRQIEHLLQKKIFLELFVRVEEQWSRDPKALKKLGYST